jgi:glycosyltransferase involved in cell wall biosynthesis
MDEILPMTKRADAVICMTSPNDPNNSRALANKQFEAMICGRPIICTKETYPGEFTEKEKCGITAYYTEEGLKKAIINLRDNPKLREYLGKNALKTANEKFNWEKQEEILIEIYKNIT